MRDPVTDFRYPDAWVASCRDPDLLAAVRSGHAVLTADGTVLWRGYTTGTTAAAAAKAAVLSLETGRPVDSVTLTLPSGVEVTIPVTCGGGRASARKYAGDYPDDVTADVEIVARATTLPSGGVEFRTGIGIGRHARTTPRHRKGDPAISEGAGAIIRAAVEEALGGAGGALIELSIPDGEERAERTLNPRVGVEGGLSLLGTTGLVEPWDDHLTASVMERVGNARRPVLTTGRIGLRYARLRYPGREVILVGGRIGEALARAPRPVLLFGLPGLILRWIDPRILDGTGCVTVEDLSHSSLWETVALPALRSFCTENPGVQVTIISRDGEIIGGCG